MEIKTRFGTMILTDEYILTRTSSGVSKRKYKCIFKDTGYITYAGINDAKLGSVQDYLYPIKDLLNKILQSNQDGPIVVLPEIMFDEKLKRNTYKVKFLDTGNTRFFTKKEILNGKMKDLYKKRIFEVACIGNASKKNNYKLYSIWYQMISRCYNKNHKRYNQYGKKGVKVSEEWLCFEFFLKTVQEIEGFDLNKISNLKDGLCLDKDDTQKGKTNKIYSKETCKFVTNLENQQIRKNENLVKKIAKNFKFL